jgi:glycosyltransferase involved in cell wall biosynthesis
MYFAFLLEQNLIKSGLEHGVSTLICFSHLRWNFVYQRPQHLMSRAAKSRQVIYFEEPLEDPNCKPHLRLEKDKRDGVLVVTPILPPALPPRERLRYLQGLLIILLADVDQNQLALWYYTPMALAFSSHLTSPICVYDNMDELSAFKNPPEGLLDWEDRLLEKASVVFTGGHSLYAVKRHRHPNMHPFPSSIDVGHFKASRFTETDPVDQSHLQRPRLGFFGVIDERLDTALLAELSALRPDWQFVMLGPVAKIDPSALPQRSNISWLGMRSYEELPKYLAGWDIGIMPFARNDATRFISPTKTPEFLAAGLPVVSTSIRDVVTPYGDEGLVEIADAAPEFVEACETLMTRPRELWLKRVDAQLRKGSWDETWAQMEQLMYPTALDTAFPAKEAG